MSFVDELIELGNRGRHGPSVQTTTTAKDLLSPSSDDIAGLWSKGMMDAYTNRLLSSAAMSRMISNPGRSPKPGSIIMSTPKGDPLHEEILSRARVHNKPKTWVERELEAIDKEM